MVDPGQRYIPQNLSVHRLKVELDSTMLYNNSLTGYFNPWEGNIITLVKK